MKGLSVETVAKYGSCQNFRLQFPLGVYIILFAFGTTAPQWARVSSSTRFLDHTQRRTTVGRTPLDE